MKKSMVLVLLLALTSCATPAPPALDEAVCATNPDAEADIAWRDRALEAWRFARREIVPINVPANTRAIFFDADCTVASANALAAQNARDVTWSAEATGETVTLPDGQDIPAGVVSFASGEGGQAFFVMSAPSVWRAGNVSPGPMGLDTLMVAVMLHEASHIAQSSTYGARISALSQRYSLSDDFNDDSMQHDFEGIPEFTASVTRETELFFQAAATTDRAEALRLARQARDLMKARAARWFVADKAYYAEAEDLWLTMEGSGQWVGYQWLTDPRGGAISVETAMPAFGTRSRWWSQHEGLAIALTLDRLGPGDWSRHAFGDGTQTLLQMLDAVLTPQ
jgi:hypothetical protein